MSTDDLALFPGRRKHVIARAPQCGQDNCYRALFPCRNPLVVTEAVRYCATVSAASATDYPTRAIAACGTSKDRYISACSCPATDCPVKTTFQATPTQNTVRPVVTATIEDKNTPESGPTQTVTLQQVPSTVTVTGAPVTQTLNDNADGLSEKSSVHPPSEAGTEGHTSISSETGPQLPSSAGTSSPESHTMTLDLPLTSMSLHSSLSPEETLRLTSMASPETSLSIATSSSNLPGTESTPPSTSEMGPGGLSVGLVAVIAVAATLVVLLLLSAVVYCCLKRRKARKAAASRENIRDKGFDVPAEWKPPVELPHQTVVPRQAELDNNASTLPPAPASLPGDPPLASRYAAGMQSTPPPPSPAELFVMPAELPVAYRA